MNAITEYQIVSHKIPDELVKTINEMIKEGWQPAGGVFVLQSPLSENKGAYVVAETLTHQAMVKLKVF